jgi:hypothetical protein
MTCVWNALLLGIPKDLYRDGNNITQPLQLVEYLKKHNCQTNHVKINGCFLSDKRITENLEAISSFNSSSIYKGYLCAFEDPFLFLVSQLFKLNIKHSINGHIAEYIYHDGVQSMKWIHLSSSSSHMNFIMFRNH